MKNYIAILAGLAVAAASTSWAEDLAPLEAYATPVSLDMLQLSPSGERFAYQLTNGDSQTVFIHDTQTGEIVESLGGGDSFLMALGMVHDDWLLLAYSVPRYDFHFGDVSGGRVHIFDLQTSTMTRVGTRGTHHNQTAPTWYSLGIAGIGETRETMYLPGITRSNKEQMNLYKFNVDYGITPKSQAQGSRGTMEWFANGEDELFVREDFFDDKDLHSVVVIEGGDERVLYEREGPFRELDFIGPTTDWGSMVYRTQEPGSEEMSYFLMDLQNGSVSGPVFSGHRVFAIGNREGGVLGFESWKGPEPSYLFLDADFARRFSTIQQTFPDALVELISITADRQGVVVRVSADWSKSYFMYFAPNSARPVLVAKEEKKVPRALAVPRKEHLYIDDEGRPIRALVTAKPGVLQAGDAPAVVLRGSDLSWVAQYFASRNYVVIQPELRGSEFGGTMAPQGEPDFRTSPVKDADLVIRNLVQAGIVDKDRMCIFGKGRGGFMALSSGFRSSFDYRCVAAMSTYPDLPARVARVRDYNRHGDPRMVVEERTYGFTSSDKISVQERSPHTHVSEFSAPVLMIYLDKRDQMYERQAKSMAAALEGAGKDVTVMEIKGDDVYLDKTASRAELLHALADFVSKHVPN